MKDRKTGKVWLVGAGPSDPGLFTLKGKEVLEKADVVVYDALVGPAILHMMPEQAEKIDVGKRSSHHTMPQEQINELLVQKAKEGRRVVRLKGGDPFLFGRGGEELELLVKEQIPYEVVPGIPSAISVPAYQGIPVTHRDFCSSVHIITGHKRAGMPYDIDFEALVRTKGTLVFLMGAAALGEICRGLLAGGMPSDRPAAFLMRGTTAVQERVVATVGTLEETVKAHGVKTPAIIVVGDVCALAETFSWYEKLPLGGTRVLLTRPKELISETAAKLRELGAEVLELPAIRTVKTEKNERLYQALEQLEQYQWLVFTSRAGVRIFFEEMQERHLDVRHLGRIKIAVIGSGTKCELEKHGVYADLVPQIYDGAHLGEALAQTAGAGERILIARAAIGSKELTDALEKAGKEFVIDDIPTYDTVYGTDEGMQSDTKLQNETPDYVLFTSASTVRGFAAAAKGMLDFTEVKAVCIGKQTKAAADTYGMQTWMAQQATVDSLLECLLAVHEEQKSRRTETWI